MLKFAKRWQRIPEDLEKTGLKFGGGGYTIHIAVAAVSTSKEKPYDPRTSKANHSTYNPEKPIF
jgi:hypothetical protein